MCLLSELSASVEVHIPHGFSGLKVSTACGLSGCNTFSRNVVQLSTYTMAEGMRGDGRGCARWLSHAALSLSMVLYKPPSWWMCLRTRGPWSTRVEEERWKGRGELILTLTIGLPVQTFRERAGKEKERESRTGWKREVGKENVVEKKTPTAQPAPSQTGRRWARRPRSKQSCNSLFTLRNQCFVPWLLGEQTPRANPSRAPAHPS